MMKRRFEIVMLSIAAPEGEEEKSQAYYITKVKVFESTIMFHAESIEAEQGHICSCSARQHFVSLLCVF